MRNARSPPRESLACDHRVPSSDLWRTGNGRRRPRRRLCAFTRRIASSRSPATRAGSSKNTAPAARPAFESSATASLIPISRAWPLDRGGIVARSRCSTRVASWIAKGSASWYEPFGMVILEGMLYGLAIVATDVGGPRAILADGETGIFCQARDVSSLERALIRVTADESLRHRLGRRASEEVRSRWLFDTICPRMRDVYEEFLHAPRIATVTSSS
jgi:Glycosyl transferases group 1